METQRVLDQMKDGKFFKQIELFRCASPMLSLTRNPDGSVTGAEDPLKKLPRVCSNGDASHR